MPQINDILIKPHITERTALMSEKENKYVFFVHLKSNKLQIKGAIEAMYGVTVDSVNTLISPGKKKSKYTKSGILQGKTSAKKKAIVRIAEGDTIDFYSNI